MNMDTATARYRGESARFVLLASDDDALAGLLAEAFDASDIEVQRIAALEVGLPSTFGRRYLQRADAAIIDLRCGAPLPGAANDGENTWQELHARHPGLAVVVIVNDGCRALGLNAIMNGAQDFVEEAELGAARLRRAVDCAVERLRLGRRLRREAEGPAIDSLHENESAAMTSQLYGLGTLQELLPGDHRFLVAEYATLLDRILQSVGFDSVPDDTREALVALVERVGALRATPRDLVSIHSQALSRLLRDQTAERREAAAGESRYTLLEAMGYLAYYYRRYSVQLAH